MDRATADAWTEPQHHRDQRAPVISSLTLAALPTAVKLSRTQVSATLGPGSPCRGRATGHLRASHQRRGGNRHRDTRPVMDRAARPGNHPVADHAPCDADRHRGMGPGPDTAHSERAVRRCRGRARTGHRGGTQPAVGLFPSHRGRQGRLGRTAHPPTPDDSSRTARAHPADNESARARRQTRA
jgi:hypothetical protein